MDSEEKIQDKRGREGKKKRAGSRELTVGMTSGQGSFRIKIGRVGRFSPQSHAACLGVSLLASPWG